MVSEIIDTNIEKVDGNLKDMRVKYAKTGNLQYISHLDLCRTLKRILTRTGIAVDYSEGYNPRPKITYSPPLSIGIASVCEFLDIKLHKNTDFTDADIKLRNAFENGLRVIDIYKPQKKLSEIKYAEYKIEFEDEIDISRLSGPCIVSKVDKNGRKKDIDITQLIQRYEYDGGVLSVVLPIGENNVNPDRVAQALSAGFYTILKIKVYIGDTTTVFS
jgi:radical SAM-linked protein